MPKKAPSVAKSWERIERWIAANDTARKIVLSQGASDAQIRRAERLMRVRLPDDLRESYRRHDGSNAVWLFEQGFLLPLGGSNVAKEYMTVVGLWDKMRKVAERMEGERTQVKGPIRAGWWREGWVPLTENWQGAFICLDLDPPKRGTVGQVFFFCDDRREFLEQSWAGLLARRAAEFESGEWVVTEDGLIQRERRETR